MVAFALVMSIKRNARMAKVNRIQQRAQCIIFSLGHNDSLHVVKVYACHAFENVTGVDNIARLLRRSKPKKPAHDNEQYR